MQKQNYEFVKGKIKKPFFRNFFRSILLMLDSLLAVLGLRSSKKFWGIVYDSKSKQPLDPVVVKLISVGSNLDIETCYTDMSGRYGFLVNPGKYKIIASRTNYSFPSKIITENSDGIFDNVYHGDLFEVLQGSAVVAPNIPMDPVAADWNQEAKLKYTRTHPKVRHFVGLFIAAIFWLGLILDAGILSYNYYISPIKFINHFLTVILYCYLFLILLNLFIPKIRLWGLVLRKYDKQPVQDVLVEASSLAWPDSVFTKVFTTHEGKFFLRINPGEYILHFKRQDGDGSLAELGQSKIRVGRKSLVNDTFYMDF